MGYVRKKTLKTEVEDLRDEIDHLKGTKKEKEAFNMPRRWKRLFRASKKKSNENKILFLMLKRNGRIEGPILAPYSDNVFIYKYKPYEIDPRAVWEWGKFKVYLFKEVDRRPISNLNLKEIKKRGDLTDSDEILIKAVMRAVTGGQKKPFNAKVLIVIIIIVVIIAAFFMTKGAP